MCIQITPFIYHIDKYSSEEYAYCRSSLLEDPMLVHNDVLSDDRYYHHAVTVRHPIGMSNNLLVRLIESLQKFKGYNVFLRVQQTPEEVARKYSVKYVSTLEGLMHLMDVLSKKGRVVTIICEGEGDIPKEYVIRYVKHWLRHKRKIVYS